MPQGKSFLYKNIFFYRFVCVGDRRYQLYEPYHRRASGRLKEIGIRKTVGALKGNLIRQFLFESLFVTFISFLLSLLVVNLLSLHLTILPINNFLLVFQPTIVSGLYAIVFALITGLLSGSYPALMLSRFKPVALLKKLRIGNRADLSLRKGLVVFQFTISVVMIIATIVLFMQVRYLNNTNLGFNKDLLVVIDVNTGKARANFESVKTEMAKLPAVKNVSVTSRVPGEWKSYQTIKIKNKAAPPGEKTAYMFGADKDFMKTFEMHLLNGRNFDNASDSNAVILNETAARLLGITDASGQIVDIPAIFTGRCLPARKRRQYSVQTKSDRHCKRFSFSIVA